MAAPRWSCSRTDTPVERIPDENSVHQLIALEPVPRNPELCVSCILMTPSMAPHQNGLAALLAAAAQGSFPHPDGTVAVVPAPAPYRAAVVAFTAQFVDAVPGRPEPALEHVGSAHERLVDSETTLPEEDITRDEK